MNLINLMHQERRKKVWASEKEFREHIEKLYYDNVRNSIQEFRKSGAPRTQKAYDEFVMEYDWMMGFPFKEFIEIQKIMDEFTEDRKALNDEESWAIKRNVSIKDITDRMAVLREKTNERMKQHVDRGLAYKLMRDLYSKDCEMVEFADYEYLLDLTKDKEIKIPGLLNGNLALYKRIKENKIKLDGYDEGIDRVTLLLILYGRGERRIEVIEDILHGGMRREEVNKQLQEQFGKMTPSEVKKIRDVIGEREKMDLNASRRSEKTKAFVEYCGQNRYYLASNVTPAGINEQFRIKDKQKVDVEQIKRNMCRGAVKDYRYSLHQIMTSKGEKKEDTMLLRNACDTLYWMDLTLMKDLAYCMQITDKLFENPIVQHFSNKEYYYNDMLEMVDNYFRNFGVFLKGVARPLSDAEREVLSRFKLSNDPIITPNTSGILGFTKISNKSVRKYGEVIKEIDRESATRRNERDKRKGKREEAREVRRTLRRKKNTKLFEILGSLIPEEPVRYYNTNGHEREGIPLDIPEPQNNVVDKPKDNGVDNKPKDNVVDKPKDNGVDTHSVPKANGTQARRTTRVVTNKRDNTDFSPGE